MTDAATINNGTDGISTNVSIQSPQPSNSVPSTTKRRKPSAYTTQRAKGIDSNGTSTKNASLSYPSVVASTVWPSLQPWLPARNPDMDHWWNLSGPHFATMLKEGGYTIQQQYEAMLFHYHYIVPALGERPPPDGKPKWSSPLSLDGSPIEYSFKWDTHSSNPDVRFTVECFGDYTGTMADPFNIEATKDMVYSMSLKFPDIDLTWFNQLVSYCFDSHKARYVSNGGKPTTSMVLAFEFLKKGLMVKAYFVSPRLPNKGLPTYDNSFWQSAVNDLAPASPAADKVFDFLASNRYGKEFHPAGVSIDCVSPSQSRVKLYVQSADTSFAAVRATMTMGGTLKGLDGNLNDLFELIKTITGISADHPEDAQVPACTEQYDGLEQYEHVPELLSGYIYYFDIKPGAETPDIKFYIPTRHYSKSDATVLAGIKTWMKDRGRTKYLEGYGRMLDSICSHRSLDDGTGIHAFVSSAFVKGDLSVTSYLGTESYDPRRLKKGRFAKEDNMDHY